MTDKRIDTQARIEAVRFQNQTGSPAAPAAGYSLIYVLPTGLYMETSGGAVIGPFVTGTAPAGGRTLIAENTPTGTGTTSFTSIPGGHKKIIIEAAIRGTNTSTTVDLKMQANGDTTAGNYRYELNRVNNFGGTNENGNTELVAKNIVVANSATANEFTHIMIELIQYANTNFYKLAWVRTYSCLDGTTLVQIQDGMWHWANTGAITQLNLILSAGNYATNSVLRLYYED